MKKIESVDQIESVEMVGVIKKVDVGEGCGVDMVNHPPHYGSHPSGVECIAITEHMNFCVGNAMKYLWRADQKGSPIEDLEKARWYIDREIQRRRSEKGA